VVRSNGARGVRCDIDLACLNRGQIAIHPVADIFVFAAMQTDMHAFKSDMHVARSMQVGGATMAIR
jgi:hypothetical protein